MLTRGLAWFAVLSVTLTPLCALGRDIHVNNLSGDDRSIGAVSLAVVEQGPVRTIGRALKLATKGDRVVIANTGQPYRESISLSASQHCGFSAQPFVIEGNGAILDGTQTIPPIAWRFHGGTTFRFTPRRLGYQQLFLDGRPAERVHLTPDAPGVPDLQPRQWCIHEGAIFFAVDRDKSPADYNLTYAALPVGITLYHVHDVAIANLKVQGFQLDGINAHDGVRDCILSEVTSRGNGRAGICSAGNSQLEISASLIGDNGTAQIYTEGLSATSILGSDVLENTAPAFVQEGGQIFIDGQLREAEE